jgi:hypothetical protein
MSKFLININDGTVCDLAGTVVVDTDKLDEVGKALLHEWNEGGNDSTACELGEKYGTPLEKFTDNKLSYANTVSLDPASLRDEILARVEGGFDDEPNGIWAKAQKLTDEQLDELGQYIIQDEQLWSAFGEVVTLGVREYINEHGSDL